MTVTVSDPSANIRDEIAQESGMPELSDKIWFHKTAAAVIDANRCIGCGGCIAACPSRSIGVAEDGKPTLVKMCTGCSACWDYCPLAGLRVERLSKILTDEANQRHEETSQSHTTDDSVILGQLRASYSVKAATKVQGAQDGGAVTTLVAALLEAGEIDGAILTKKVDAFHGAAVLVTNTTDVNDAAGSVYHQSHPLAMLNLPLPAGVTRLAFVGTPCQISVLRALQRYPWKYRKTLASAVILTVALFCTRSFDPDLLESSVAGEGVDTNSMKRIDIRAGELIVQGATSNVLLRRPVREFSSAALSGCDECSDFSGLNADISVGNVGSSEGESTVVVRSESGEKAFALASPRLILSPLTRLDPVERIALQNKRRAERSSARGIDPDGGLWISYTGHLSKYSGTDRTPKPPPDYRSYHFDVSC